MKKIFLSIFLLASIQLTKAQIGAQNAFEFLRMPVSTRAIAMGGLMPAFTNQDLSLAIATPSLLDKNYDRNFTVNQEIMFAGILHGQTAYAKYYAPWQTTFVGNIQYLNYGNFKRTDETGVNEGHFGAQEMALQAGFGRSLNKLFSYGANAKFIYANYDDLYSTAVAADLSVSYKDTAKKVVMTFQIVNVGAQLKPFYPRQYFEDPALDNIPTDVRFSVSKRLPHLPLAFHITAHHLQQFDIRYNNPADNVATNLFGQDTVSTVGKKYIGDKIFRHFIIGGELYLGKHLTVQLGYNNLRRQELKTTARNGMIGFSCGFHLTTKRFEFGYSHAWYYLPSATNSLSLSFLI